MLGFFGGSDVFHYDLRGDSLQMEVCGNAGCLIDRFRGMDTSGLPDFMEFRCVSLCFARRFAWSFKYVATRVA